MSENQKWGEMEKQSLMPDRLDTALSAASDAFRKEVFSCLQNPVAREILPSPATIDFTLRLGTTVASEVIHALPAWARFQVQTTLPALLDGLKHILCPESNSKVPCYPHPVPPCYGSPDHQPHKAPNYYERKPPVIKPADDNKKDGQPDNKLKAPTPVAPSKETDTTNYKHSKDAEGNDVLEDPTTGIKITTKKNGDEVTEYRNGDVITEFKNGDRMIARADKTVTRIDTKGRFFTTDKDGKVIARGQESPDNPSQKDTPVVPNAPEKQAVKPPEAVKPAAAPTEWKGEKGQTIKYDAARHPVEIDYPNGMTVKFSQLDAAGKPGLVQINGNGENQTLRRRGQSEEYDVLGSNGQPSGDVVHKVDLHQDGSAVIHGEKDLGILGKKQGYMVVEADGRTHQHLA